MTVDTEVQPYNDRVEGIKACKPPQADIGARLLDRRWTLIYGLWVDPDAFDFTCVQAALALVCVALQARLFNT